MCDVISRTICIITWSRSRFTGFGEKFIKGIGGGLGSKWGFNWFLLSQSQIFRNFLRNWKSSLCCRDIACRNFKKSRNPIHFGHFQIFFSRFGQIPYFWPQINFRTPYWAKLLHFMGFPNVTWEFLRFWDFRPFFGSEKSKIALFCDFLDFLHQNGAITGQKIKISKNPK